MLNLKQGYYLVVVRPESTIRGKAESVNENGKSYSSKQRRSSNNYEVKRYSLVQHQGELRSIGIERELTYYDSLERPVQRPPSTLKSLSKASKPRMFVRSHELCGVDWIAED